MTRVIAGAARGRRLAVPAGQGTRPTGDRAREALFATITSLAGSLDGSRFLDLYAGSGAVGLEALSRGAARVTLVESAAPAVRAIKANVAAVGLPGVELIADRVERVLARGPGPADISRTTASGSDEAGYDVVFADPPYALPDDEIAGMLALLPRNGWLAPGALVVVERASRSPDLTWPDGFAPDRARRYGEATFWYGHARGTTPSER